MSHRQWNIWLKVEIWVTSVQKLWTKPEWMNRSSRLTGKVKPRGTSILMYDGEKATSERDRDRKRRARRMLCSGVHGSEELPKASDQPGKHSREALMISEK